MTSRNQAWSWRPETDSGQPITAAERTFVSQSDAESWLGESWLELADAGAAQVVLLHGDTVVYGPMRLDLG